MRRVVDKKWRRSKVVACNDVKYALQEDVVDKTRAVKGSCWRARIPQVYESVAAHLRIFRQRDIASLRCRIRPNIVSMYLIGRGHSIVVTVCKVIDGVRKIDEG